MQTSQHPRPPREARDPGGAAPGGGRRAARARDRAAVVAPGRGAARRLGGADDRHHRHRVRQVAVLQPADARRPVPRLAGAGAVPLPHEGARAGPGAGAERARRRSARGRRSTTATRRASSARRSGGARTSCSRTRTCCTSAILPNHPAWGDFFANLAVVVVDEAHVYRGVFGSHVANVLRRLRRVCDAYGTAPRILLASATIANPGELAERLTGLDDITVIDRDGAPGRQAHDRDVEPADHRREDRRAPLGARRGGRPARRPRERGRAHDRVHEVAQGGGADVALRAAPARGSRPRRSSRSGSRRTAPATRRSSGASSSAAARGRAARRRLHRTRSSWGSTSARSTRRSASRSRARSPRCGRCGAAPGGAGRGLALYVAGEDALDQFFCRHPGRVPRPPGRGGDPRSLQRAAARRAPAVRRARGAAGGRRRGVPGPGLAAVRGGAGVGGRPARAAGRDVRPAPAGGVPGRARCRCGRRAATAS